MKPRLHPHDPIDNAAFETLCVHFAEDYAARHGAAAPAIYQTSTFIYPSAEAYEARRKDGTPNYDYTRGGNPTTSILEEKIARLENGSWCEAFGSGMGAISAAINTQVHSGAHVVCVGHVYGPTNWYLRHLSRFGVKTTFVRGLKTQDFIDAITPDTKLVYLESPTSGHFEILDGPAIAAECRARGITTIFDNSYGAAFFQRPLEYGVDMVVHSATKYMGGHSDVVAGVVIGRDEKLHERLFREVELCGATLDPFAAWLLLRGLRTLPLRMKHHHGSTLTIAKFLSEHSAVRAVHHPGLPSHPQHELATRVMSGFSSLFSFELCEQTRDATIGFLNRLKLFRQGVSWGGHESLAIGGTFFSDPDNPKHLIRLHCGLEATEDLIAALRTALESRS